MEALGNWEQYDTRLDVETICKRQIDGEAKIIVFSPWVILRSLVPGLAFVWYFCTNFRVRKGIWLFIWATERFSGSLLVTNTCWMLGHESCKILIVKNVLCFLVWVGEPRVSNRPFWTEHLRAEAPCPSIFGLLIALKNKQYFEEDYFEINIFLLLEELLLPCLTSTLLPGRSGIVPPSFCLPTIL